MKEQTPTIPLFEINVTSTLEEATSIFKERGTQYSDTWRECQWLAMKAAAKLAGLALNDGALRLLAAAALVDIKYQRLSGGYKRDSVIDGINYAANWAAEVETFKRENNIL